MKQVATEAFRQDKVTAPDPDVDATYSTGMDTNGFEEIMFQLVLFGYTAGELIETWLQESDDDGASDAYATVSGTDQTQTITSAVPCVFVGSVSRDQRKRYLRVGISSDVDADLVKTATLFLLSNPKQKPVTQVNTAIFAV